MIAADTKARAATFILLLLSNIPSAFASTIPFRVVIDPGHGGIDQGAIFDDGKVRVAEKDATLLIARQAAQDLRKLGYEVILTRDKDQEVPLPRRTAMANELGADVFLSIHMNSTPSRQRSAPGAQGIETYILNNTSDASSRRLAHLENSVLGNAKPASGPGEELDVALILKDLRLDANLSESKRLACGVQDNLVTRSAAPARSGSKPKPYHNRGVRQALFHVLLGADMPSALVEAGFLSNPHDRSQVLSPSGRKAIGMAIASAVDAFHRQKNTRLAQRALSKCRVH